MAFSDEETPEQRIARLALRKDWYKRSYDVTKETLPAFLEELRSYEAHDYNTAVYAAAAAAHACVSSLDLGLSGFQAQCIGWECLRIFGPLREDEPARLLHYRDLLYPQYDEKWRTMPKKTWAWLQQQAKLTLAEEDARNEQARAKGDEPFPIHPDVRARIISIAAGAIPFGWTVED